MGKIKDSFLVLVAVCVGPWALGLAGWPVSWVQRAGFLVLGVGGVLYMWRPGSGDAGTVEQVLEAKGVKAGKVERV